MNYTTLLNKTELRTDLHPVRFIEFYTIYYKPDNKTTCKIYQAEKHIFLPQNSRSFNWYEIEKNGQKIRRCQRLGDYFNNL